MLNIGAVCEGGGSRKYNTGSWRTVMPEILEHCNGCGICELFCPDSCMEIANGRVSVDYFYCKGCGICARECAKEAIKMVEERK